ncbi:MAG TPA: hypothetical protein GX497_11205 [Bacillus bacterium]|nr:hypothetical protein [Bacillus sp. (in: firmicutes)]
MIKTKSTYFKLLLLFLSISTILLVVSVKANTSETANGGIFGLNHMQEGRIVKLDGEWEFYWQKLYTPQEFLQSSSKPTPQMVQVPSPWRNYNIGDEKLPFVGYATYRLRIELAKEEIGKIKALYISGVSSAYKLWVNGEEKAQNGMVGLSKGTTVPNNVPKIVQFQVDTNEIELIMQVSNFQQRKAGIFGSVLIGEPETILTYKEKRVIYRSIIVTSLTIIGIYHILMFLYRRKERSLIYFGVLCILVAIRATILEEGLASEILFFLNWEMARKLEYLGASAGVLFFTLFAYTQFPEDMNRKIRNIIAVILAMYSLFIILTPAIFYTKTMVLLQFIIDLVFLYLVYVYITAFRKKREGSLLNTIALLMLFLTTVNDTLYYNHFIRTTELASVGLFFFLFTQSIMISKRYAMAFVRTEKLSNDLAILNTSLERQVLERTKELQQANEQLKIANESLEEAHQSRSMWIRNISHEISTPLTSIRAYTMGMLDGVVPSNKDYIQLVYNHSLYLSLLLHDLHDMTDIENRQIKFDLQKVNICEYIYELYEKNRLDIEKQEIHFVCNNLLSGEENEFLVLMDPLRIEQVIVNLLKNAQRFVNENGKIDFELGKWDEHNVVIKVKDNGTGIKEDELDFVFDRFYKSKSQSKTHNGSGLGLAISKEIIEYHNGIIGVESKVGKGSCFYFILPLQRSGM